MSADVLFIAQEPNTISTLFFYRIRATINVLPFQIKENMVNHKKMVHPPCVLAA